MFERQAKSEAVCRVLVRLREANNSCSVSWAPYQISKREKLGSTEKWDRTACGEFNIDNRKLFPRKRKTIIETHHFELVHM